MRYTTITLGALLFWGTLAHCGGSEQDAVMLGSGGKADTGFCTSTLRVLTWNLGEVYLGDWVESRANSAHFLEVAILIKEHKADIVALQEVKDKRQLEYLLALLGPPWTGEISNDDYDRHAALLTRLPAEFIGLRARDNGRAAQAALLDLNGFRLVATSVHLSAFDEELRLDQTQDFYRQMVQYRSPHFIMAGDFNIDGGSNLDDYDEMLYDYLTRNSHFTDAGEGVGDTTLTGKRLDFIFYRSSAIRSHRSWVLEGNREGWMDHDPVLTVLQLGTPLE